MVLIKLITCYAQLVWLNVAESQHNLTGTTRMICAITWQKYSNPHQLLKLHSPQTLKLGN